MTSDMPTGFASAASVQIPVQARSVVERVGTAIRALPMSVSHDRWHLDRVMEFAFLLQARHGGDASVLGAAVLLHDLGRADTQRPHGIASVESSAETAAEVLASLDFSSSFQEEVLRAIREHDQPDLRPSTIEGRLLKEADFLAGLGAWGILRIAMWSGETHRPLSVVLDRLQHGMARRVASLEFPESRVLAQRELAYVRGFTSRLGVPAALPALARGKYVVLEGISGSGKDTQGALLQAAIAAHGEAVDLVCEPNGDYRHYKEAWETERSTRLADPLVLRALMMADRASLVSERVSPALAAGRHVVSVRNYLSTAVYQGVDEVDALDIASAHWFAPLPDLMVLLDLPAETAFDRVTQRDGAKGLNETIDRLATHRSRYLSLSKKLFGHAVVVVDASLPTEAVASAIREAVEARCPQALTQP